MTLCAMLNLNGGQVLFGVTPDGVMAGQQMSDRSIEEVSAELQRIDPPAFPVVERVPIGEGRCVIAVSVSRGPARPYQYRGTAYQRIGNTTVAMSANEYNQMLFERMHSEQRWENQPAVGVGRWRTSIRGRFDARSRRLYNEAGWKTQGPWNLLRCFAAWAFSGKGSCYALLWLCSGIVSGLSLRCLNVCFALPVLEALTARSSWTIGNSTATPSHSWRAQNVSYAIHFQ